ncbi:MAG: ATP-binding protein [Cyanobacteria bacterium P01_E01_bin.42]
MLDPASEPERLQSKIQALQQEVESLTQTVVQLELEAIGENKKQRKREETFKLLQKLSQEISATNDIGKIYQTVVRSLAGDIGFDRAIIYESQMSRFVPVAHFGYEENWNLNHLIHPFFRDLAHQKKGILVNGKTKNNPLIVCEEDFQVKYFIALPFAVFDQFDRILFVGNQKENTLIRPRLTKKDLDVLKMLSNQITIAFQQIELYEQSQRAAREASDRARELRQTLKQLKNTQAQLIQNEKMSGLGHLVAGIAHEINNPVNFIYGNVAHLKDYSEDLLGIFKIYQENCYGLSPKLENIIQEKDPEFIVEDMPKILNSIRIGAERIREIVNNLKLFSRFDESELKTVDIHDGLDSTLKILNHRLYNIKTKKAYGNLPKIECYAGQLNQVFMNLIVNAIEAIEEKNQRQSLETMLKNSFDEHDNRISIITEYQEQDAIIIRIRDNGMGMSESVRRKIFDPFFTTKPVGQGTGMGLSISYQIITEKHKGTLQCTSILGEGTEFEIELPVRSLPNPQSNRE